MCAVLAGLALFTAVGLLAYWAGNGNGRRR